MSLHTLHIGLLLFPGYQWLDAAGSVDYLNSHSQTMIKQLNVPKAVLDKASYPSDPFMYLCRLPPDHPFVPGTEPSAPLLEGCAMFLRERVPKLKALQTVCTGSMAIAQAGVLDGLHVCSNKMALKMSAEAGTLNKRVRWVGDRRWIVDGKVWSSAGIDLSAEFARTHFDPEVVELAKLVSEYEPDAAQPDLFAKILEGINLNDSEEC